MGLRGKHARAARVPAPRVVHGMTVGLVTGLLLLETGGCSAGTSGRREGAQEAAQRFGAALREHRADDACALLAPATRQQLEKSKGTPCADALSGEKLAGVGRVRVVDVYTEQARVVGSGDTMFLADFGNDGWKVVAAGCVERRDTPYDCDLTGR